MKSDTSTSIDYITLLRYPLALGVVFIHAIGKAPQWQHFAELDMSEWLKLLLAQILPSVAVSCFFLMAGFLFFRSWRGGFSWRNYLRQLRSRWGTLLLPYLLWNLLAWLRHWGQSGRTLAENWRALDAWNAFWGQHNIGHDRYTVFGNMGHLTAPVDVPLWFVRDLMLVVLFAPVLYVFLYRSWRWWLVSLLLLLHAAQLLPYVAGCSPTSVVIFALGGAVALSGRDFAQLLRPYRWVVSCLFLLLLVGQIAGKAHFSLLALQLLGVGQMYVQLALLFVVSDALMRRGGVWVETLLRLAPSSFFVYAAHTVLFLTPVDKVLHHFFPAHSVAQEAIRFLLLAPLTTALCTLLYFLLRKYFPRCSAPLTGQLKY